MVRSPPYQTFPNQQPSFNRKLLQVSVPVCALASPSHIYANHSDMCLGSGEWFRAAAPTGAARSFPLELAGVSREEKLTAAALAAVEAKADAMLVCMLDEVAWLLNVRGTDVPHCPVLEGFVIVNAAKEGEGKKDSTSTATFFVEQSKLPAELAQELAAAGVELMPYSDVYRVVEELAHEGTRFMLDPNKVC